ncbi:hypothetical protein F5880DRAFT_1505887 [Lentinula raphanica]|nr:hypothetical protein F5880DRAFT_1505887 [Lentinula raphanica]
MDTGGILNVLLITHALAWLEECIHHEKDGLNHKPASVWGPTTAHNGNLFVDSNVEPFGANVLGSNPANAQIRLGRPPGSANISRSATPSREHSTDTSRKRGRPPGTGRLQRQAERLRCLREERSRESSKEAVQSSERMSKKQRLDEADTEPAVSTPTATTATHSTRSTIDLTAAPPEILPHPEHAEGIETGGMELSLDDEVDAGEGEIGLAHNGLGVKDEDDDESYDGVDQNANDTNRPRRIPNPLPEWLETQLRL